MAVPTPSTPSVTDEIITGDALGLRAAARLLPGHRGEGRACASTIWRWIRTGTRTSDGRVVHLEAARIGSRWVTSRAAIGRYMAALTETTSAAPSSPPSRSPAQRRRDHDAARQELDQILAKK